MLRILGSRKRLCDGLTRRDMLQAGASALLGISAADFANQATAADLGSTGRPPHFGKAKNVILLYLYGAVSQIDTFDPKPEGPEEIRGVFSPIGTSIPGVQLSELLPKTAREMHRVTLIRSMTHPVPIHNVANMVSGIEQTDVAMELNQRDPRHWPFFGSVVELLDEQAAGANRKPTLIPSNVIVPWTQSAHAPAKRAGFFGGFLGPRYDPASIQFQGEGTRSDSLVAKDPYCGIRSDATFNFPATSFPDGITLDRFQRRRGLLTQLDDQRRALSQLPIGSGYQDLRQMAFELCDSATIPSALNLAREPQKLREQYGAHLFGQSALMGRRLIEAGSRVVTVLWDEFVENNSAWDTHVNQTRRLKNELCPGFDQAYSALIADLDDRGMLDETLVLVFTEHGRTPKPEGNDGRNHWSGVYSIMMAGAGVGRGQVVGASDKQGGFVKERPISPNDILHTVYHLLGIDAGRVLADPQGKRLPIVDGGAVVREILA